MKPIKNLFNKIFFKFKNSILELKSIKNLSIIAFLMALLIVLNFMVVEVSNLVLISFEFVVVFLLGAMFGPFVAAILGFLGDLLCYLIHPVGPFFIWYAVSFMVDGLIYGIFLYKNKLKTKKVVIVQIARDVLTNVFLNTFFIWLQFGGDFLKLLIFVRVPKNIIKIPINCFIVAIVSKILRKNLKV